MSCDFEGWRTRYDTMSYDEHVVFYDEVWTNHPGQIHFDAEKASEFFSTVGWADVFELGGWRGELANILLPDHAIARWRNYEICRGAADAPVVSDERYSSHHPTTWVWDTPEIFEGSNVFVGSHVIEHMRAHEFDRLLDCLGDMYEYAFLASPLTEGPVDWTGYNGSHILEIGWAEVTQRMKSHGFELVPRFNTSEVRVYAR